MKFAAVFVLAGMATAATDDCANARSIASAVGACEAYQQCLGLANDGWASNDGFVANGGFTSNDGFQSNAGFAGNDGFNANSGFTGNAGFDANIGYEDCELLSACGEFDGCSAEATTTEAPVATTAPQPKCDSLFIGDGICDQECNTAEFEFDGGDCQ